MHKTLHPDIFWLGKQWAVTRYGLQALNPKLKMRFDSEASRIWEEGLAEAMPEDWFDIEDFRDALNEARKRSQQTPHSFRQIPPGGGER
jgi:hypothetical protein